MSYSRIIFRYLNHMILTWWVLFDYCLLAIYCYIVHTLIWKYMNDEVLKIIFTIWYFVCLKKFLSKSWITRKYGYEYQLYLMLCPVIILLLKNVPSNGVDMWLLVVVDWINSGQRIVCRIGRQLQPFVHLWRHTHPLHFKYCL